MRSVFLFCGALFGVACNGGAQGTGALADSAFLPSGIEASQLPEPRSDGARLVGRYCSQCHGIPSPASQSAADWPATFRRMLMHMERSRHMSGMAMMMRRGMGMNRRMPMADAQIPSDDEQRLMLAYLEAHSSGPLRRTACQELGRWVGRCSPARATAATRFPTRCSTHRPSGPPW